MDEDRKDSKIELPPLGEVIEGINPKDWLYSKLGRDYFAKVIGSQKLFLKKLSKLLRHARYRSKIKRNI